MRWNSAVLSFALPMCLTVVSAPQAHGQSPAQNTAARILFLEGRDFWDDGKFADAEKKFHEALTRYPKADQSDRTAFYRITTLIKLVRTAEALAEIENFNRNYPQSRWESDVEEERISLAGNPSTVRTNLIRVRTTAPGFPDHPTRFSGGVDGLGRSYVGLIPIINSSKAIPVPFSVLTGDASLKSEIFRLILEKNPGRGIELAKENLKADPSDPVVISNLGTIANSSSPEALPFLVMLAGGAASPNARSQAIFWITRRHGDKKAVAEALTDMLGNSTDKQTEAAVAEALARLNAVDRRNTIDKLVEVKTPERLVMFEKIYRNSASAQLRAQMTQAAAQIPNARAVTFLSDVARNDKDANVRRSAIQALATRTDVDTVEALEDLLRSIPVNK